MSSASNVLMPLHSSAGDAIDVAMTNLRMNKKGGMNAKQAGETARDFESMFLAQMLDSMFGESTGTDSFGDEETSDIYRGMMMKEYAEQISLGGGIGIADYVKTELMKMQEV